MVFFKFVVSHVASAAIHLGFHWGGVLAGGPAVLMPEYVSKREPEIQLSSD